MKFKFHKILIFILFAFYSSYPQTWERISDPEMTLNVHHLEFDLNGNLYAATDNGLFFSSDYGQSWNNLYPTLEFENYVGNVLPMGDNELLIGTNKGIFYSGDRGLTWEKRNQFYIGYDVLFKDSRGNVYAGFETIYKSTDKGNTWTVFFDSLSAWSFYETKTGAFLVGTECGIFLSDVNSESWIKTGYFDCGDITVIKGINDDGTIFIIGADRFKGIRYSTDVGYSWEYVSNSDTIIYGTSIVPINNKEIYFASRNNGVFRFDIQNSGLTNVSGAFQYGISAMAYDSLGYLYVSSDGIYRSKNTLDTSKYIRNNNNKIDSIYGYSLAQNYPNPFNSSTTIEYSLKEPGKVYIAIYNPLGENVAEVFNEQKSKGRYRLVFDASGLASGVYFYQIKIGNYSQIKKMVLLR